MEVAGYIVVDSAEKQRGLFQQREGEEVQHFGGLPERPKSIKGGRVKVEQRECVVITTDEAVGRRRLAGETKTIKAAIWALVGGLRRLLATILPTPWREFASRRHLLVHQQASYPRTRFRILEGPVSDTVRCLMGTITYGRVSVPIPSI